MSTFTIELVNFVSELHVFCQMWYSIGIYLTQCKIVSLSVKNIFESNLRYKKLQSWNLEQNTHSWRTSTDQAVEKNGQTMFQVGSLLQTEEESCTLFILYFPTCRVYPTISVFSFNYELAIKIEKYWIWNVDCFS